jgi:hypothetical protein
MIIKDLFFALRIFAITVFVTILLQVKVGKDTAENHMHKWLKDSVFVEFLQQSIDGGVALTKSGYQKADAGVQTLLKKMKHRKQGGAAAEGERGFGIKLKRYNDGKEELDEAVEDEGAAHVQTATPPAH